MEKTGIAVWDQVEIPQKTMRRVAIPPAQHLGGAHRERVARPLPAGARSGSGRAPHRSCRAPRSRHPPQWRHYLHRESGPVQPSPVLPDRPVVIRPDRALTLLPGQSTVFFLEIPVWFRLSTIGSPGRAHLRGAALPCSRARGSGTRSPGSSAGALPPACTIPSTRWSPRRGPPCARS